MDGFSADYLAGLTSSLTDRVLEAGGRRVREAYAGAEAAGALRRCFEAGIIALFTKASIDVPEETPRLAGLFTTFFSDLFAAGELSKLLRGRVPDQEELSYRFEQIGFDAKTLPDLDFRTEMAAFRAAFVEAARTEPLLQTLMRPGDLLEQAPLRQESWSEAHTLVKKLRAQKHKRVGVYAGRVLDDNSSDGIRVIYHWGEALPPEDPIMSPQSAYLHHVFEMVGPLSLTGIDHGTSCDLETRVDLHAVYTALLTSTPVDSEPSSDNYGLPDPEAEMRHASALAHLDRYSRLVLLGDPGSGKSTFVNFVALCLAGERLQHQEANLKRLTALVPVPDEDELVFQSWSHGPLLPLPVVLGDFAARGLPEPEQRGTAQHLCRFIDAELMSAGLKDYIHPLWRHLREEGGVLLLDGLDEVPTTGMQGGQIKQVVEDFAASFPYCRILITSRSAAYRKQGWQFDGFREAVLAPFEYAQICHFIDRWYMYVGSIQSMNTETIHRRARLLKRVILSSDRLRGFAQCPLLLTLMALLDTWRGGSLPEKREKLYADAVDLLMDCWERQRVVRKDAGRIVLVFPSLIEWLKVQKRDEVRSSLNQLAYETHVEQAAPGEVTGISGAALVHRLLAISQNPDVEPLRLADYLSRRAGLLVPRGMSFYAFPHRVFQEYLAACYLTDHEYPDKVASLARKDPAHWQEVALLAGAKSAGGSDFALWALVDALCYQDLAEDEPQCAQDGWGALLAGQILVENADITTRVWDHNCEKLARVKQHLLRVMEEGKLLALERIEAGRALAKLGDPRGGIGLRGDGVPDILWCEVPAGPFLMGSVNADAMARKDERPQHTCEIESPYAISRYPITNAQFAAFVEADGYRDKRYWSQRGWIWCENEEITGPQELGEPWNLPNHPRGAVSWYEAVAFCRWLTDALRESGNLRADQVVSLPTEPQWEKAVRGEDGRYYSWGSDLDPNRANYEGLGIGTTSAVGCFPEGASPYGVEEVSGNVWEWTRSLWGKDWNESEFAYPYDPEDGREDLNAGDEVPRILRGGAFYNGPQFMRCACRLRDIPLIRIKSYGFRVVVFPSP